MTKEQRKNYIRKNKTKMAKHDKGQHDQRIEKPAVDKKQYKYFELENKLKVLLI